MTYKETIDYLFNVTPVFEHVGQAAYKPGIGTTLALDKHYHHPHKLYPTIHIAGTNGKGSCSHSIASILQEAGYRVGLYTSPHLADFRERIRVNGECVSEQYVVDFVDSFIKWNRELHPSFFELTTALAFRYFADMKVDIAVIEVGLGGRLDCTNIITPLLSVITNISFDHTGLLGNTLEKIAGEKAGIIKPHVPVVIGESLPQTRPVFVSTAEANNSPIVFAEEYETASDIDFELKGNYQEKNKQTILCAIKTLTAHTALRITDEHIARGMARVCENTGLMGRWQTISERPKAVCDTGHNLAGWQYLAPQIRSQKCKTLRIVFGMVDDKDIDSVMNLLPTDAVYYWTQADNHRAISSETVKQKGDMRQLRGQSFASVALAYDKAVADAATDDFIFVGGSSYVVADLLCHIARQA